LKLIILQFGDERGVGDNSAKSWWVSLRMTAYFYWLMFNVPYPTGWGHRHVQYGMAVATPPYTQFVHSADASAEKLASSSRRPLKGPSANLGSSFSQKF
jgi:hypothetical protein